MYVCVFARLASVCACVYLLGFWRCVCVCVYVLARLASVCACVCLLGLHRCVCLLHPAIGTPKDRFKMAQDGTKTGEDGPKMAPRRPKSIDLIA